MPTGSLIQTSDNGSVVSAILGNDNYVCNDGSRNVQRTDVSKRQLRIANQQLDAGTFGIVVAAVIVFT